MFSDLKLLGCMQRCRTLASMRAWRMTASSGMRQFHAAAVDAPCFGGLVINADKGLPGVNARTGSG